jgi:hypothetical protein
MVTLHNLSAETVTVSPTGGLTDLARANRIRQVLGDPGPPYRPGQEITLGRYGFRWLRLPN